MDDPEINAMSAVASAMAELDDEQRARVIRWAGERYSVGFAPRTPPPPSSRTMSATSVSDDEIVAEAPEFEHFAELVAATQPKTNEDKALVAGYWLQAIQGHDKWQSQSLNVELKNLGHAIPNITEALSSNINKKPQRVIQLQKSGNTRQGRKTYKITHEGLVYVQGMLRGGGEAT